MGRNSGIASRPTAYRRRNTWLWRALAGLMVLAVAAVVGVSVYVGWSLSHPAPRPVDRTPAEVGLAYESVAFPATDGLTIRAWFLPAEDSSSTIIMAHGYTSNRLSPSLPALELARAFVDAGFNVLMFDFRNSGESEGDVTTLGYHEVKDIYGAVDWLKSEKPAQAQRIGLIGFSMGATTAILAAANEPRIEAVVADSPFSDLRDYLSVNMPVWTGLPNFPFTWLIITLLPPLIGLDTDAVSPIAVVPYLKQPLLLIHTEGDDAIPSSESRRLFEAARPGLAELWIVPGTRHVGARQVDPAAYDRRVIGFFEKTLGTGEL
nr:alpha/beta hydrolase [Bacillota bacterium]